MDGFHLSSGYTSQNNKRCVFTWNTTRFKDPSAYFHAMNEKHAQNVPNVKPGVLLCNPRFEEFNADDAFVKDSKDHSTYGVGKWWGGTIGQLKPIMSTLMCKVGADAVVEHNAKARPYMVCRSGSAGIQRYAQTWCGDNYTSWKSLKYNIPIITGMGLSGQPNEGADIGGFAGPAPEAELLLRWIQNGIFQPRFCMNSANNDNTVTQPWMYEENLPYVREAYNLRYRLLPYLYSLMYESNQDGMPAWRPLFLEFPQDPKCYTDKSLTFMFGKSILVANVVEKGATTRSIYLPAGCKWYDINDNLREYEGGQTIEVPVTLASIPMFLRGSAIVVTTEDVKHILKDTMRQIDLLVSAESGWYYNLSDRTIWAKFNKPAKKDFTVTVSTEKFDLIGMAED